jgi:citrate lyase subunit beta/citryl-CoA lyase
LSKALKARRSILFVPGSSTRMLEKARTLPCDVVVLDLEDSVAPEAKAAARQAVCAAVKNYGKREVVVRINAADADDLAAVSAARPDAILLPKIKTPDDIAFARGDIALWAMIETSMAVLNLAAIAGAGVEAIALGTNDLMNDMRAQPMGDRRNLWGVLNQAVIAARAHGVGVIDGTFNAIADAPGFAAECAQGRAFGFDGKTLIHPGQIDICNVTFAPSEEEIARARHIIAAFAREPGKGAIALDGRMVEKLHMQEAERLIAFAGAIAERR